jgi:uncharacterized membrane protein YphA (DoxX/SURF4 family)
MLNARASSNLGSHIYGFAAIALGLIGLVWRDFASVWQPVPNTVPHRIALACIVAVCFLLAGAAVQWQRTARIGFPVLAILYFMAALLWLPRVIGYPRMIGTWLGFAEELTLVLAAIIGYASLAPRNSVWSFRAIQIARLVFGLCLITFGLAHLLAIPETAAFVPKWIPPSQRFWAIATGVAHLLAGLAILSNIQALLAARLFTTMLLGFGILIWLPAVFAHPEIHLNWAANAINLAIAAAAWVVADSLNPATQRNP